MDKKIYFPWRIYSIFIWNNANYWKTKYQYLQFPTIQIPRSQTLFLRRGAGGRNFRKRGYEFTERVCKFTEGGVRTWWGGWGGSEFPLVTKGIETFCVGGVIYVDNFGQIYLGKYAEGGLGISGGEDTNLRREDLNFRRQECEFDEGEGRRGRDWICTINKSKHFSWFLFSLNCKINSIVSVKKIPRCARNTNFA